MLIENAANRYPIRFTNDRVADRHLRTQDSSRVIQCSQRFRVSNDCFTHNNVTVIGQFNPSYSAIFTAPTKARILAGSLMPGADSTPTVTSTA